MVPIGASLLLPAVGAPELQPPGTGGSTTPRLRGGTRLKHLESEGRWLLQDPEGDVFVHLDDDDGALAALLDGTWSLSDLVAEAERRHGPMGAPRLARLLADLGDRGVLRGVEGRRPVTTGFDDRTTLQRWFTPRERPVDGVGEALERLYRRGGWALFTRPGIALIAALIVAGLVCEVVLIANRYGAPFVVARHIGIGGLVFLGGRALVVAVHESAHGLAMASFGRPIRRAGFKLIGIFPYTFVDTSESWFEPKARRMVVAAAGPLSDLALGGTFAVVCLVAPAGTVRDIFFQLAFAAYIGAFFNLNPFLDRDGYHLMVDWLGEPGLRARARAQLSRRLAGHVSGGSVALQRYALAGLGWSVCAGGLGIFMTLRYLPVMKAVAPDTVVWIVLITVWVLLFVPVVITLGRPLGQRVRGG
jgi:putative peptide zinc metalloprotease protein